MCLSIGQFSVRCSALKRRMRGAAIAAGLAVAFCSGCLYWPHVTAPPPAQTASTPSTGINVIAPVEDASNEPTCGPERKARGALSSFYDGLEQHFRDELEQPCDRPTAELKDLCNDLHMTHKTIESNILKVDKMRNADPWLMREPTSEGYRRFYRRFYSSDKFWNVLAVWAESTDPICEQMLSMLNDCAQNPSQCSELEKLSDKCTARWDADNTSALKSFTALHDDIAYARRECYEAARFFSVRPVLQ